MKYHHTNRPGFLLGLIDFCTAGLFFLIYMPLGLQDELDEILGRKTQRYWVAYVLGIPTMFIYTLVWMARIAEELRDKAKELGIEGPYTSWWHMFGWNTFGVLFFGPAVATYRFFDTLNKIERKLNAAAHHGRACRDRLGDSNADSSDLFHPRLLRVDVRDVIKYYEL